MSATAVRRVVSRLQPGGALTDAELVRAIVAPGTSREAAFAESPDGRSFVAGYGVSEFERLPAGGGAGAVVVWGRKP
ncbi:hypothetical protein R5W24_006169 [Gemmata sp. JC717]|uniref:hypothetical protein n=1 Tax=Gemmata algarum TaxID=2975278 RepID=UPI0021BAD802|nr:hypothetical protein [Gemmata algarum]MDY3556987.1 hypothetical protein [Gemmata algarum]